MEEKMEPIILASASPRRQEILKLMNIPFAVKPADIDETVPSDIDILKASEFLAAKKVEAVIQGLSPNQELDWVLGADTTVILNGIIYGKPKDQNEAFQIIKALQGKTHTVATGIALYNGKLHDLSTRNSINKVTFAPMTDEEINWYLETAEWHGVAGAYRIQGLGSCFIKSIEGTDSSIMGLPIFELYDILREQNYKFE